MWTTENSKIKRKRYQITDFDLTDSLLSLKKVKAQHDTTFLRIIQWPLFSPESWLYFTGWHKIFGKTKHFDIWAFADLLTQTSCFLHWLSSIRFAATIVIIYQFYPILFEKRRQQSHEHWHIIESLAQHWQNSFDLSLFMIRQRCWWITPIQKNCFTSPWLWSALALNLFFRVLGWGEIQIWGSQSLVWLRTCVVQNS